MPRPMKPSLRCAQNNAVQLNGEIGRGFRDGGLGAEGGPYSTVTLLAKLRGWSTSVPLCTAT
jgi:hypothetical protein